MEDKEILMYCSEFKELKYEPNGSPVFLTHDGDLVPHSIALTLALSRQQLAQCQAEVAALSDICDTAVKWWQEDIDGTPKGCASYPALLEEQAMFQKGIIDTQATAEAHNAKVREAAIREYSAYLTKCTGMEMIIESAEYNILGKVLID